MEGLLEEGQIKLSSVVSDLLGASGGRILAALAKGETDPVKLAALGGKRLRVATKDLQEALGGQLHPTHQALAAHQAVVERLCQVPGIAVPAESSGLGGSEEPRQFL